MSLDVPSLILDTDWAGEPYLIDVPSVDGSVPATFLHGLNPNRVPSLYRVFLPSGAIRELFACEKHEPPQFSNAINEGAFWVGVPRDCTLHCAGQAAAFYGLRVDASGELQNLGPICPLPDLTSPQKLVVHPSKQLALVVSHAAGQLDAGVDTNLYARFVSFDETGRTGMTNQYKATKPSQVAASLFLPHRRAAIYRYADPSPSPAGPPPTVEEIRELSWGANDEVVESVFEPANSLLRDLLAVYPLDGEKWVVVGRARNPTDPEKPRLALLFNGDQLEGLTPLRQVESGGTIVSWRGEPFIFWRGPLVDNDQTEEIWTRRLDFEPIE